MNDHNLPQHCSILRENEKFCFSCHPEVPCFNECCHQLDLILTPYDVLRLKNKLHRHSGMFLEQFVIIEWEEGMLFPTCYLTMVDDGKASCVFVKDYGCRVYEDRPAACRAYPVGRGVSCKQDGTIQEQFVLLKEPHCRGFEAGHEFTAREYFQEQGLEEYNRYNDKMTQLFQHPKIRAGFCPTKEQAEQYIMALYNLDTFRPFIPIRVGILFGITGENFHVDLRCRFISGSAGFRPFRPSIYAGFSDPETSGDLFRSQVVTLLYLRYFTAKIC